MPPRFEPSWARMPPGAFLWGWHHPHHPNTLHFNMSPTWGLLWLTVFYTSNLLISSRFCLVNLDSAKLPCPQCPGVATDLPIALAVTRANVAANGLNVAFRPGRDWDDLSFCRLATAMAGRHYLVGGLEPGFYDFPYIGNVIIPTDELIFFSEG